MVILFFFFFERENYFSLIEEGSRVIDAYIKIIAETIRLQVIDAYIKIKIQNLFMTTIPANL